MSNTSKLIFLVIIVVVIIAGTYFAFGSEGGFSLTGAFTGPKECITSDAKNFYDTCTSWKNSGYENKPSTLKVMTTTSARQMCDKLLAEYRSC